MGVCGSSSSKENNEKNSQVKKKSIIDVNDQSEFVPNMVTKNERKIEDIYTISETALG